MLSGKSGRKIVVPRELMQQIVHNFRKLTTPEIKERSKHFATLLCKRANLAGKVVFEEVKIGFSASEKTVHQVLGTFNWYTDRAAVQAWKPFASSTHRVGALIQHVIKSGHVVMAKNLPSFDI